VSVLDYTCVTGCGAGRDALDQALRSGTSALRPNHFTHFPLATFIGQVDIAGDAVLPDSLSHFDCRNNRLAWLALQADGFIDTVRAAVERHGPHRVGIALGTSTSSIGETETAYRFRDDNGRLPADHADRPDVHTPHSLGLFVQHALGTSGPCLTTVSYTHLTLPTI